MKSKLVIFALLILLFLGFVAFRFFVLDKKNNYGRIQILSSPTASVFIDNLAIGKTPFENKYKMGEYMLKLIPEGGATDAASWQGKIKINKNSLTYINRELGSLDITSAGEILSITKMENSPKNRNTGEIYIETEPSGAIINLDNDEKGISPLTLVDITQGNHELSVFMPGFFRRNQKVNVESGYRVNVLIKLAIDQTQQKLEKKSEASSSASTDIKNSFVLIKDTPTGWLRVREEPSIEGSEAAKVKPGEKYALLEKKEEWYKIKYDEDKIGWVSASYAEIKSE